MAVRARRSSQFTRFDGNVGGLPVPSPVDIIMSATRLEHWADCPFGYFLQRVPGCFFRVGSANAERGLTRPHHNPCFDFDEAALPIGVEVLAGAARRFLEQSA